VGNDNVGNFTTVEQLQRNKNYKNRPRMQSYSQIWVATFLWSTV